MNRNVKLGLIGVSLLALVGCNAQKPAQLGPEDFYTPSADGQTRLIIFRDNYNGLLIQPQIYVDGQPAAKCTPGKATSILVSPGAHRVSGGTLKEKSIDVSVPKGNTVYVSCQIGLGIIVGPVELGARVAAEVAPKVARMKSGAPE